MTGRALAYSLMLLCLLSTAAIGDSGGAVTAEAQQGFKVILELWRAENYEGLFSRLEHPAGKGWPHFSQRIVQGSRLPACCWEMLQDVRATVLDTDNVVLNARVGFEVEGVGTRFVTRDFRLHRSGGVWMLPMQVVLDLSGYNLQRIPRKVYERQTD